MSRRYRPHRKNTGYTIPLTAVGLIAAALLLWLIWAKGESILHYFKGKTVVVQDPTEANNNLSRLLADLSGDRAKLLELTAASDVRLGFIKDETTRRQFRWFLMERLLSQGLWDDAVAILPEVEDLASLQSLERLAEGALEHEDFELQLRLDQKLQDRAINRTSETELLLRSIRRTAETCIKMHNSEEAVKAISRLDAPAVLARLSTPQLAAEAADLQILRADVSTAKEHPLQLVRNILEQAGWPPCKATSRLMLEEVTSALNDNPSLPLPTLKEIEDKLLHCRDALLDYADREHKLPQCYLLLGQLRLRMENFEGCAQALTLANAFAEGYGQSSLEWQLEVCRLRSRANMARNAKVEALEDCRFLAEHEKSPESLMAALTYLSANVTGQEREKVLSRLWQVMQQQPKNTRADKQECARIADEIATLYVDNSTFDQAAKWALEAMKAAKEAYPDLTDGKALRASMKLALIQRKRKDDTQAARRLREVMQEIEKMTEDDRKKLDAADRKLYAEVVREYARTCLLMGDTSIARAAVKKIKEGLPEKRR